MTSSLVGYEAIAEREQLLPTKDQLNQISKITLKLIRLIQSLLSFFPFKSRHVFMDIFLCLIFFSCRHLWFLVCPNLADLAKITETALY